MLLLSDQSPIWHRETNPHSSIACRSPAQVAASRAALIATAIRAGKLDASLADLRLIPSDKKLLKTLRIDGPWNKLYELRKFNVEAFYNWHQAERILSA